MVWTLTFGGLAVLSAGLFLWQYLVARRFPLHVRVGPRTPAPGVTLLKPLKGVDAETARCLRSWMELDYTGPVQVLFGVASADDAVCPVVRALLEKSPDCDAELVICGEALGANAKVSTLIQLERRARHEVLIVSDADVWVPPDLASEVTAPLADKQVGLVNCLYQLANPASVAMHWEAIAANADFWSQVLQSRSLRPLDFALGAVMAVRRGALRAAGGFAALADHLADDYQLGHNIARAGWRIELSSVVVECHEAPKGWREVWAHQLRWARTIRVCQPWPYFFSILSNPTLWPLLWLVLQPSRAAVLAATCALGWRAIAAVDLQARLTRSGHGWHFAWLVPIRDLLGVLVWALAFFGNRVEWRGQRYRVRHGGKLEKQSATSGKAGGSKR